MRIAFVFCMIVTSTLIAQRSVSAESHRVPVLPSAPPVNGGTTVVSNDGRRVLTTRYDSVILWDSATGRELHSFFHNSNISPLKSRETGAVTDADYSANQKRIVTATRDSGVIVWDALKRKEISRFAETSEDTECVALSGDGRLVVTGTRQKQAILRNAEMGKVIRRFSGHDGSVLSVFLSGDGRLLLTGSDDKLALLWNSTSGKLLQRFSGHTKGVVAVAMSNDGRRVITGSSDKTAIIWDAATGKKLRVLKAHTASVNSVAFCTDGRSAVSASYHPFGGGEAIVWDITNGQPLRKLGGNNPGLSRNGKFVVSVTSSESKLIETAGGKTVNRVTDFAKMQRNPAHFVVWGGQSVLVGIRGGGSSINDQAFLWRLDKELAPIPLVPPGRVPLRSMALSMDGKHAVFVTTNGKAIVGNTVTGRTSKPFTVGRAKYIALSRDGAEVIVQEFSTTRWDVRTGQKKRSVDNKNYRSSVAALSPTGDFVVVNGVGKATLWNTRTGKLLKSFSAESAFGSSFAVSDNGKQVLTAMRDRTAILWNAATGKPLQILRGHKSQVTCVALSRDGKHILTAAADATAVVWDAATGKQLRTFRGHERGRSGIFNRGVRGSTFSPDGTRLLTAAGDGTVRLWDVTTSKQLCALLILNGGRDWLAVTPDGYFDGSKGCEDLMAWRRADSLEIGNDAKTKAKYRRSGLLKSLLQVKQSR